MKKTTPTSKKVFYTLFILLFIFSFNIKAVTPPVVFNYPTSGITMKALPGQNFRIYTQMV